jgi:two-component system, NarL family, nitrate/nitrite response regulator NarL
LYRHGWRQTGIALMHQPKNFSDTAEPFSQLSAREQQVIHLVCDGLSNREIAEKLGVTEGTVKCHLHSIYEQLGIRSRFELMIALTDRMPGKA